MLYLLVVAFDFGHNSYHEIILSPKQVLSHWGSIK